MFRQQQMWLLMMWTTTLAASAVLGMDLFDEWDLTEDLNFAFDLEHGWKLGR